MSLTAALGVGSAALDFMSSQDQGDEMADATRASIGLQRDQFDYAKSLQDALLRQQEPRRQGSQRAMRSLSMMMGLGDPGASAPVYQQRELQSLRDQLENTDEMLPETRTTQGTPLLDPSNPRWKPTETETVAGGGGVNPEYESLQQEIAALEAEMPGGEDDFTGPKDVTDLPGYDFFRDEGLDALASSGAARGMQLSGRQMESAQKFGQGLASQYRGQLMGELQAMAGMRPSTQPVSNLSQLAVGQGQALGPLQQQLGAIGAAQTQGTYGALGSALSSFNPSGGGFSSPLDTQFGQLQQQTKGYAGGRGF